MEEEVFYDDDRRLDMVVSKKISFSAAHFLPDYPGKCSQMHGHTWVVELGVRGAIGKDGMVVDFGKLKEFLEKEVEDKFDHKLLNDVIPNPTAENICNYVYERWYTWWRSNMDLPELDHIQVWESEDSYALLSC